MSRQAAGKQVQTEISKTRHLSSSCCRSCKLECKLGRKGVIYKQPPAVLSHSFAPLFLQTKQRNILRIGIHSLGSVLWGDDVGLNENPESAYSLTRFLYALRGLLRTSLSACMITVPAYLIQVRLLKWNSYSNYLFCLVGVIRPYFLRANLLISF